VPSAPRCFRSREEERATFWWEKGYLDGMLGDTPRHPIEEYAQPAKKRRVGG